LRAGVVPGQGMVLSGLASGGQAAPGPASAVSASPAPAAPAESAASDWQPQSAPAAESAHGDWQPQPAPAAESSHSDWQPQPEPEPEPSELAELDEPARSSSQDDFSPVSGTVASGAMPLEPAEHGSNGHLRPATGPAMAIAQFGELR